MSDSTLTRMDLAEAVFREVGLSRHESAQLVESVLAHISDALVRGEQVKISSFGTFSVRDKNERIGRNPKTGEEVPITPRRVLSFRPSHLMKDRVAAGNKKLMSKSPDAFRSIGEVSSLVGVAPHVLRYWESQFTQLAPVKRGDGRRYYRPDDVRLVAGLCQVMREEGLSIRGARRLIAADRGAGLRQIGARRLGETLGDTLGADRPAMRLALPESGTTVETRPEATTAPPVTAPRPAPEQLPLSWAAPSAEAAPEPTPTPAASLPEPPPATVSDTSDSWLAQLVSAAAALRRHPGPLPASLVRALRASARESR